MKNRTYNFFANDYDLKRKKPWKDFESYLKFLREKGYCFKGIKMDIGCANGRHFNVLYNNESKIIGIDNSIEFLLIALKNLREESQLGWNQSNQISLILADFENLPIRYQKVQNIFSIATLHHAESESKRIKVISEMFHSLNKNGYLIFTVWRRWQNKYRRYFIIEWFKRTLNLKYRYYQKKIGLTEFGDKFVPWTLSSENMTFNRFYHFFTKKELIRLLKLFSIQDFRKFGGSTNKDNFFLLVQKNSK